MTAGDAAHAAVDEVARRSYSRLLAHLAAGERDLAAAEDALAEAFAAAVRHWPQRGVPDRPEAWLVTAARRTLIDAARRREVAGRAVASLARLEAPPGEPEDVPGVVPDTRLELLFTCAHPAIDVGVRSPLMLQAVLGLDAARVASAFLVSPTSMGQRLVRARPRSSRPASRSSFPGPSSSPSGWSSCSTRSTPPTAPAGTTRPVATPAAGA